jgi:AmiR/NasT family two-component response regulator
MSPEDDKIIEQMSPREVFGEAVTTLMAIHDVDRAGAFEMLVQRSSDSHRRVRRVAEEIVEQSRRGD